MRLFFSALLFCLGLTGSAQALTWDDIRSFSLDPLVVTEFEFVATTQIPSQSDGMMALCYLTRGAKFGDFPITNTIIDYVLVSENCTGTEVRPFSTDQMITAQSLNLIDPSIPTTAQNSFDRTVRSYGILIVLGLLMLLVVFRRIRSLLGLRRGSPLRRKAANRVLSALCHAAKCDGLVTSREVAVIARTMARLTKRHYNPKDIMRLADRVHVNLTFEDYAAFGKRLRDREKEVMLQGVFYITMEGDRMLPIEYQFVTDLAHALGIPAEDFRRILYLAFDDREANPI